MRSKQPIQSQKPTSSFSFIRNVIVGMLFFDPIPRQEINKRIQQSANTHQEAILAHQKSQNAITETNDLINSLNINHQ